MGTLERDIHRSAEAPASFEFPPRRRRKPSVKHGSFHTTWRSEIALLNSTAKRVQTVVLLVVAVLLPFFLQVGTVRVLTLALIAGVGAVALSLIAGVAGQLSLGHAGFLGLGAYSAAFITTNLELSFYLSLPVAAAVAGLAGLILAPMAFRLRGLYLAVVTLGFVLVMQHVFRNATPITGGVGGTRIEGPELFGANLARGGETGLGFTLPPSVGYYLLALVLLILTMLAVKNLLRSRTGRAFASVRDHDIAAGVVGVNVFATKTKAFVISSAMTGVAGALLAGLLRATNHGQWDLLLSVDYLAMVVLGGVGTVLGPVLGAFFIQGMPEVLDRLAPVLPFISSETGVGLTPTRFSRIVYGLLLAAVMVFEPMGLFGVWSRIKTYFSTWPFSR